MHYQLTLLLLWFSIAACGAPSAPPAPAPTPPIEAIDEIDFELSEALPPQYFRSESGVTLEMVHLQGSDKETRALVRFKGIQHPLAGKALLVTGGENNGSQYWRVHFDGMDFPFVAFVQKREVNKTSLAVTLTLPRVRDNVKLSYHPDRSLEIEAEDLIATHRRQLQDGSIARVEALDPAYHKENMRPHLEHAQNHFREKCGRDIEFKIDWDNLYATKKYYSRSCITAFSAATLLCDRDQASRRIFLDRVRSIQCGYGDSEEFTLSETGEMQAVVALIGASSERRFYQAMVKLLALTRTVAENAAGKILVLDPDREPLLAAAYLGDGITMYQVRRNRGTSGAWGIHEHITFERNAEGWSFQCPERALQFKSVSDERRHQILKSARFEGPLWKREAFSLTRDDRGVYYYVDRMTDEHGGKDFRVFIGQRGQLKATNLIDIVHDSDGMIFSTKTGTLRLMLKNSKDGIAESATWINRKKKRELVVLPVNTSWDLIYTELGTYDSDDLGTVCE